MQAMEFFDLTDGNVEERITAILDEYPAKVSQWCFSGRVGIGDDPLMGFDMAGINKFNPTAMKNEVYGCIPKFVSERYFSIFEPQTLGQENTTQDFSIPTLRCDSVYSIEDDPFNNRLGIDTDHHIAKGVYAKIRYSIPTSTLTKYKYLTMLGVFTESCKVENVPETRDGKGNITSFPYRRVTDVVGETLVFLFDSKGNTVGMLYNTKPMF